MAAEPHESVIDVRTDTNTPNAPVPHNGYTRADYEVSDTVASRIASSVPENTNRSYVKSWEQFVAWCAEHERVHLPATGQTIASYVSHMIDLGRAPSTISNRLGAIRTMHTVAGHEGLPPVKPALQLLRGYKRERARDGAGEDEARPLLPPDLERMAATLDLSTFVGRRDHLVIILGFAMMARRSELSYLRIGDVVEVPEGIEVTIRSGKTDKESEGVVVPIPPGSHPLVCPVTTYHAYRVRLADTVITEGGLGPETPLLRSVTKHGTPRSSGIPDRTIWTVVMRLVRAAGLPDPDGYSAHSLRAGGLTAALQKGVPVGVAARHGRWSPTR